MFVRIFFLDHLQARVVTFSVSTDWAEKCQQQVISMSWVFPVDATRRLPLASQQVEKCFSSRQTNRHTQFPADSQADMNSSLSLPPPSLSLSLRTLQFVSDFSCLLIKCNFPSFFVVAFRRWKMWKCLQIAFSSTEQLIRIYMQICKLESREITPKWVK